MLLKTDFSKTKYIRVWIKLLCTIAVIRVTTATSADEASDVTSNPLSNEDLDVQNEYVHTNSEPLSSSKETGVPDDRQTDDSASNSNMAHHAIQLCILELLSEFSYTFTVLLSTVL
jgi:hypothetical protein